MDTVLSTSTLCYASQRAAGSSFHIDSGPLTAQHLDVMARVVARPIDEVIDNGRENGAQKNVLE